MAKAKETPLLPAYLIAGADQLKRETVLQRLRKRLYDSGDMSLNFDVFSGESATGAQIVAAANTLPFASDKRLVQVDAVDRLKKADVEVLISYLESPCETTVLALISDKDASKVKVRDACLAHGKSAVINCAPFKRSDLSGKVREMARGYGVEFTPSAAAALIDLVGENTIALDNEISKLALAHRGADAVNENEVIELVARTTEIKPWEVADAFCARNVKRCVHLYRRFMETPKTNERQLLPLVSTRVRELITYKALQNRGVPNVQAATAAALGYSESLAWRFKNHARWAPGFTEAELEHALISLRDIEMLIKQGEDEDEHLLMWMVEVASR